MKYNGIPLDEPLMHQRKSEAENERERLRNAIQDIVGDIKIEVNRKELQKYREESDSVLSFVRDCCELREDGSCEVGSTELYKQYDAYCNNGGQRPCSQKAFVERLMSAYAWIKKDKDKVGKRRTLVGICLKDQLDYDN